jgi:hypothetical protein
MVTLCNITFWSNSQDGGRRQPEVLRFSTETDIRGISPAELRFPEMTDNQNILGNICGVYVWPQLKKNIVLSECNRHLVN